MLKGRPGREQQGKGTQENCSATWLVASGFMVMGFISRLTLASGLAAKIDALAKDPGRLVGLPCSGPFPNPPG